MPDFSLKPGSNAYCAGAGEDISFDLALHARGVAVTCFDPTPRAVEYVRTHDPGPPFSFHAFGWWDSDGSIEFYEPKNPQHVSYSITNIQETSEYFMAEVKTVRSTMEMLGDAHVNMIKMDIEGAERRVVVQMFQDDVKPEALLVELDGSRSLPSAREFVRQIVDSGYRLLKIEGWNYSFALESKLESELSSSGNR